MQGRECRTIVPRRPRILVASQKLGNLDYFFCFRLLLLLLQFLLLTFYIISHVQCISWVHIFSNSCIRVIFIFISSTKSLRRVRLWFWSPRIFGWVWRLLLLLVMIRLIATTISIDRLIFCARLVATSSWLLLLSSFLSLSNSLLRLSLLPYKPGSFHLVLLFLGPIRSILRSLSGF